MVDGGSPCAREASSPPSSGTIGSTVTITGGGFIGTSSVTFNGVAATHTVNSANQITATVPAGATTGAIAVNTPGGGTLGDLFCSLSH